MTAPMPPLGRDIRFEEVLTLAEAAAYLRVEEAALAELAEAGSLPARKISGGWRLSKRALNDWLCFGPWNVSEWRGNSPRWLADDPVTAELLATLERRLLNKLKAAAPATPGSKEAVVQSIGQLRDEGDQEEWLAELEALRAANNG